MPHRTPSYHGDGDCYLCSKPGWHCDGERPVQDATGEPMRSIRVDWTTEGLFTISPSTGEPTFPEWDFVTTIELIEILDPTPQEKPQQKAEVTELAIETAVSDIVTICWVFPDAPDSLRQAAEAVLDGHNELMALLEREDREAREQQMRERSTDVPHD